MKFQQIIGTALIALALSACGNKNSAGSEPQNVTAPAAPKKNVDIELTSLSQHTDPVCEMPLKKADIADTTTYQGKVYGFCNTGCKEDFLRSPDKYLSAK